MPIISYQMVKYDQIICHHSQILKTPALIPTENARSGAASAKISASHPSNHPRWASSRCHPWTRCDNPWRCRELCAQDLWFINVPLGSGLSGCPYFIIFSHMFIDVPCFEKSIGWSKGFGALAIVCQFTIHFVPLFFSLKIMSWTYMNSLNLGT